MHPNLKYKHTTRFNLKSSNCLKPFEVNENDLLLVIKFFNTFEAHGWDDISIWMIQSCGKSCISTKVAFQKKLEEGRFPEEWKK